MTEAEQEHLVSTAAPRLHSSNLPYIEAMWAEYLRAPGAAPPEWRAFFEAQRNGEPVDPETVAAPRRDTRSLFAAHRNGRSTGPAVEHFIQDRVDQLVRNFRVRGHLRAHLDPLDRPLPDVPELEPSFLGFTDADMKRQVSCLSVGGADECSLGELIDRLKQTYCRYIGVQFMHIDEIEVRRWLQHQMEETSNHLALARQQQLRIFTRLTDAVIFEQFLQAKYVGAKTFSLEGAETLSPLLDLAIEHAAEGGVEQIVLGMAHRGRLNVLYSIIGKDARDIFSEFEDRPPQELAESGDVKYHLGHSGEYVTPTGKQVHLSLCFNPSHLEFINPVAVGKVRAKQERLGDAQRRRAMGLLIHGDAGFAGEGIVQETLNLADLEAYTTGGTLHVIVNNQIGFTTGPGQGRSTDYSTDVARMLQVPIFHVNGENPEAVAQAVRLAMSYRERYQRDVVIDLYCFRLRGHNEGDDATFTQPLMYQAIHAHKTVRDSYLEHLLTLGGMTRDDADAIEERRRRELEKAFQEARQSDRKPEPQTMGGVWQGYKGGPHDKTMDVVTGVERERLIELLNKLSRVPEGFTPNRKIERGLARRLEMAEGKTPLDWAAGEALAFASLATQGVPVRMTGQDCERGTFSQRHFRFHDMKNGNRWSPFEHLADDQAPIHIWNSALSEAGVLGFEYGYSGDSPGTLVMWEAQFGDFVNAAQVIIDQFISSAEDKWRRLSGVTLLLPHGFEGMGPEHSSARLERFLQLCAEHNMQVAVPTTPAQYFHLLRRQVLRKWRKPLVVMTPKSLLRHPVVTSSLDDVAQGMFQNVIPDATLQGGQSGQKPERVLLCSGKIYYDLMERRAALKERVIPIIRIEQLYPLPVDELREALLHCPDGTRAIFVQEEPRNMGAWWYLHERLGSKLFDRLPLSCVSRAESASPATGSHAAHEVEQKQIMDEAFGGAEFQG